MHQEDPNDDMPDRMSIWVALSGYVASARHALITRLPSHITGCVDNSSMEQTYPTFIEQLRDIG